MTINFKELSRPIGRMACIASMAVAFATVASAQWPAELSSGGANADAGVGIGVDGAGNVFVAGTFRSGSVTADIVVTKYSASGIAQWTKTYNGPGNGGDAAAALKVDGVGNVYVVGSSMGAGSGEDIVTLKYDNNGNVVWTRRFTSTGVAHDSGQDVFVDANGNVLVTGTTFYTATGRDISTIKYNAAGALLWARRFSSAGANEDSATGIVADGSGNVFVGGTHVGISNDFVTQKYSAAGVLQWTKRYNGGGDGDDFLKGIAIDPNGNVVVTGSSVSAAFSTDYLTIQYDTTGLAVWIRRQGSSGSEDIPSAISIDVSGNVIVTGTSGIDIELMDYMTVKYSAVGVRQWVRTYTGHKESGGSYDVATAVTVDSSQNVYVTGFAQFDAVLSTANDYVTIKYSPTGARLWIKRFNGATGDDDYASAIAFSGAGTVVVTGRSTGAPATGVDIVTTKH